jgi:hypothetical protein
MLQVHTCVSVHCDQCGDSLDGPEFPAHYPTEDAALNAASAQGWHIGPGGRWWCSACGPVLTCAAEGHEFTEWGPVLLCSDKCHELFERAGATGGEHPVSREYRYCRRCCLHESRQNWLLTSGLRGQGKGESGAVALRPASADVAAEVA